MNDKKRKPDRIIYAEENFDIQAARIADAKRWWRNELAAGRRDRARIMAAREAAEERRS